jgi:pyruvate/2-oxoglutarate dehydrogenase complex dihydrolipoamide dehydrogenase (E3) component
LGLDAAGIAHDAQGIVVGSSLRTANRRVYAIGDAVAGPASVARAERQARRVLRAILFRMPGGFDPRAVPRVVPTDPELASVGISEAEAEGRRGIRILRYPFVENERALVDRLPEGVVKVIAGPGGAILGAAAVGRDASEAVALWSLAIGRHLSLADMRALASPYPSRADVSRAVAALGAGLTSPWRKRIIGLLRKFG